ncbi:MAG: carbohydrate-binding module family 20 domain-containing protein [Chloroflexota bacterium]
MLTDLRLDAPAQLTATVSAVDPGPSVPVAVSVAEAPAGLGSGLRVEVGAGPVGSDPATDPDWTWLPATRTAEDGTAATFTGNVPATRAGASDVAARASADGGATWAVADRTGSADGYAPADAAHLDAVPSADTTPPPAPGAPVLQDVAGDHVQLSWSPVVANDLYAYRVLRDDGAGGPLAPIATSTRTQYTDASVEAGATYRYAIEAVDTSLNASEPSPPLEVKAEKRIVQVTFTVSLPPQTPPGETIYIAGDFQGWNPAATPMTKVDDHTWSITLPFNDKTALQYKYTRGSWEAVEKDAGCGEIPNRTLTTDFAAGGTQAVADTVEKWRDIDACG